MALQTAIKQPLPSLPHTAPTANAGPNHQRQLIRSRETTVVPVRARSDWANVVVWTSTFSYCFYDERYLISSGFDAVRISA